MYVPRKLLLIAVPIWVGVLVGTFLLGRSSAPQAERSLPTAVPVVQTRAATETPAVAATPSEPSAHRSGVNAAPGTLLYPLSGDPLTLDPQDVNDEISALVVTQLYEGLYNLQQDGSLVPAAATGFQASPDASVYTVTLRTGLVWSDGRPVVAQDYVDGVCRLLSPAMANPSRYLLAEVLIGAEAFATGARPSCEEVEIRALDDQTILMRLREPLATFPEILASQAFFPAPPNVFPGGSEPTRVPSAGNVESAMSLLSNGPYRVLEWQSGHLLVLGKNPRYQGAVSSGVERIEMPILPHPGARLEAYQEGQLHVLEVPPESVVGIQVDAGLRAELRILPQPGTSYLGLNVTTTPTDNLYFRQAIAQALDRQALLRDSVHELWHVPAQQLLPPELPGFAPTAPSPVADRAAVRALLAQAGYSAQNPPPVITIWANREGHNQALAQGIAAQLEAAGIPTRLTVSNWDTYTRALEACNVARADTVARSDCEYHIYLAGWLMDYGDAARFLDQALGSRPVLDFSHWGSDTYLALLDEARTVSSRDARLALYRKAERLALDNAVVIPLFHYDRPILVKPGVTAEFPPFGAPHLQYWQITTN